MNEALIRLKTDVLQKLVGYPMFDLSKTELEILQIAEQMLYENINKRLAGFNNRRTSFLCLLYNHAYHRYMKQVPIWKKITLFFNHSPLAFSKKFEEYSLTTSSVCSFLTYNGKNVWVHILQQIIHDFDNISKFKNSHERAEIENLIRIVWIEYLLAYNGVHRD